MLYERLKTKYKRVKNVLCFLLYIQTNLIAVENVFFVNTKRKLYGVPFSCLWDVFVSARKRTVHYFFQLLSSSPLF